MKRASVKYCLYLRPKELMKIKTNKIKILVLCFISVWAVHPAFSEAEASSPQASRSIQRIIRQTNASLPRVAEYVLRRTRNIRDPDARFAAQQRMLGIETETFPVAYRVDGQPPHKILTNGFRPNPDKPVGIHPQHSRSGTTGTGSMVSLTRHDLSYRLINAGWLWRPQPQVHVTFAELEAFGGPLTGRAAQRWARPMPRDMSSVTIPVDYPNIFEALRSGKVTVTVQEAWQYTVRNAWGSRTPEVFPGLRIEGIVEEAEIVTPRVHPGKITEAVTLTRYNYYGLKGEFIDSFVYADDHVRFPNH